LPFTSRLPRISPVDAFLTEVRRGSMFCLAQARLVSDLGPRRPGNGLTAATSLSGGAAREDSPI
jgi:hypothetical protein